MTQKFSKTISVTVDKSHLFTLGERMYVESIELLRELINNAYDADATEVYVTVGPETIKIEDNGAGMNEKGLAQFFIIGSKEKKVHSVSPRFGRKRIGQFGIGKFAVLSAADRFIVESKKANWIYRVIFDRQDWEKQNNWNLPIQREKASPLDQEGTKVILSKLKRKFETREVEKYLKESIPLRAKKFNVLLNGKRITPKFIAGKNIPIKIKTIYGLIDGEIIIALNANEVEKQGIECRVKQALVRRDLFDLEKKHRLGINRITGSVNADFLPVLSSRTDFVKDSQEYKLFYQLIKAELEKVLIEIKKQSESRYLKKVSRELKEVLSKIRQALVLNPELVPSGKSVASREKAKAKEKLISSVKISDSKKETEQKIEREKEKPKEKQDEKETKKEKPKPVILKKIRLKKLGISCGIVGLGENGPEVFSEGNMIYVNQDHPLYKKFYSKQDLLDLHLLRLITQEIVLMKKLRLNARDAYQWQSQLLKDAVCGRK